MNKKQLIELDYKCVCKNKLNGLESWIRFMGEENEVVIILYYNPEIDSTVADKDIFSTDYLDMFGIISEQVRNKKTTIWEKGE